MSTTSELTNETWIDWASGIWAGRHKFDTLQIEVTCEDCLEMFDTLIIAGERCSIECPSCGAMIDVENTDK